MIFPQDVHRLIQNKNRIAGDNKIQLIIVLFVLGNVFGFFGLYFLVSFIAPGAPLSVVIIIQLIILVIIGIFVFRFAIFDENSKKREYQGQQSDSFTRYMYIRKDNITKARNDIKVYEYADGSTMFAVELRFGSNDDAKASGTSQFYKDFMQLVAMYGFETRAIVKSENFRTSQEFLHYMDVLNAIDDVNMRRTLLLMADTIFDLSYELSNVDSVYFLVRSVYNYQKSDLELLLRGFTKLLKNSLTAFRSVKFLEFDDLLELYRDFYGIAAIDLAMMKAISLASDITEDFSNVIRILNLTGDTGHVYNTKHSDDLVSVSEQKLN